MRVSCGPLKQLLADGFKHQLCKKKLKGSLCVSNLGEYGTVFVLVKSYASQLLWKEHTLIKLWGKSLFCFIFHFGRAW